jgi:N6-adenosine-specific RNA methylase IME4
VGEFRGVRNGYHIRYKAAIKCAICHRRFVPSRSDATTCSGRCRVARHRQLRATPPSWPQGGPFDLVAVDLPLAWIGYSTRGEAKSPQAHYATLDVPALITLLRPMLDAVMAEDCVAAWWVYGPRLPDSLAILQKVGFTFRGELLTWRKPGAFGLGKTTRKRTETMWYGSRGRGLSIRDHAIDQEVFAEESLPIVIEAPRQGHSVKPDEAYAALERLYGDVRRLDLFARKPRPGWVTWGNELPAISALTGNMSCG